METTKCFALVTEWSAAFISCGLFDSIELDIILLLLMIGLNDDRCIYYNTSCLHLRIGCCFLIFASATWFCHTIVLLLWIMKNTCKVLSKADSNFNSRRNGSHIDLSMHFWRCSVNSMPMFTWIINMWLACRKLMQFHIYHTTRYAWALPISIRTDLIFESLSFAARTLQYWRIFQTRYDNDIVSNRPRCAVWCIEMNGMSLPSCENTLTRHRHRDTGARVTRN